MKSIFGILVITLAIGAWLCAARAAEAPPAPAGAQAAPAVDSSGPEAAPEEDNGREPTEEEEYRLGPEDETPLPEEAPAIESTAPPEPLPDTQSARDREEKVYENYQRLVRVMEIVEGRYVQPVESDKLFDGAIQGIMGSLDPYSAYIPPDTYTSFVEETEQQFSGIGITIAADRSAIKVVSTIEGMPAFRAGVQPGDVITKVDGVPIHEIGSLDNVSKELRGAEGSNVTIAFVRPSSAKEYTVTLTREAIPVTTLRGYRCDPKTGRWDFMVDKNARIGYVRLTKFAQNTADELDAAYDSLVKQGMKGLILDFRYNPGGLLDAGVAVADRFLDEGLVVRTQGRAGVHSENYAKPYDTYKPTLPVAILVNEFSASASEVVGGALKDHRRATLVGNRTYGKGSVQNVIDLDGRGALKLTIAYYYTPSGRLVHRLPGAKEWGLEPDVKTVMSIEEQIKLREEWARVAAGEQPKSLGEGGGAVIDTQLSRALEVMTGATHKGQGALAGR